MKTILSLISFIMVTASTALATEKNTGLSDLANMTFSCPMAALNAAAREAARAPTHGNYQFVAYSNDGANRVYWVSFESNYEGEPRLNYEVTLYCQQGWDPNKTVKVVLKK